MFADRQRELRIAGFGSQRLKFVDLCLKRGGFAALLRLSNANKPKATSKTAASGSKLRIRIGRIGSRDSDRIRSIKFGVRSLASV